MTNYFKRKLTNLWRAIKISIYSIPFGMKAINDEVFTSKASSNSDLTGTHTLFLKDNVATDLLRGEVTQAVEDLRYSTYKVDRESTNYKYIGNGLAIKLERKIDEKNIKMGIRIHEITKDILTTLNDVETNYDSGNNYTVNFHYRDFPIYQLNKMAYYLKVIKTTNRNECMLYFNRYVDEFNLSKRKFISHLEKIYYDKVKSLDRTDKLFGYIDKIDFITYKCDNEYDLIKYVISDLNICDILLTDKDIIVKINFGNIEREDLTKKFYSKNQDEKYKLKVQKDKNYLL